MWQESASNILEAPLPVGPEPIPSPPMVEADARNNVRRVLQQVQERRARVVVVGFSGTGKSSLLNAAFGRNLSRVSHAGRGTVKWQEYPPTEDCPIWIYDTPGIEARSEDLEILKSLLQERSTAAMRHPVDSPEYLAEQIHVVWWVVDTRFESEAAFTNVRTLVPEGLPIIVVLNKCDRKAEEVRESLAHIQQSIRGLPNVSVFPVVADPKNGPIRKQCEVCGGKIRVEEAEHEGEPDIYICKTAGCTQHDKKIPFKRCYGVKELINETVERIPGSVALSFQLAVNAELWRVEKKAWTIIGVHTAAATAIGASPIPFSDYPLLLANQLLMSVELGQLYDVKFADGTVKKLIGGLGTLVSVAGIGLAIGSALKCIPFIGSLVGGVTDATIATVITFAIGMLMNHILSKARTVAELREVTYEDILRIVPLAEQRELFAGYLRRGRQQSQVLDRGQGQ